MTDTLHVSTNFAAPKEVKELGESFPFLAAAHEAILRAKAALERVQRDGCQEADTRASAILSALNTELNVQSWGSFVGYAKECFEEARPVQMRRPVLVVSND